MLEGDTVWDGETSGAWCYTPYVFSGSCRIA